jgi:energy-coupling factor transporter ATP-binding protein EcfA2
VYIRRVKIRNVRGFDEVDLDFTRPDGTLAGWTVLAGRNGSGKSTLLRAMALAASGMRGASGLYGSFAGWLSVGSDRAEVELEIQASPEDAKVGEPRLLGSIPVDRLVATLRWESPATGTEPGVIPQLQLHPGGHLFGGPWSEVPLGWFLAGYGPYRRLSERAGEELKLPARLSRLVSLFRDVPLIECVEWLQQIHLRKLEKKPGAAQLERAVLAILNDGLLPDGLRLDDVDSDGLWTIQHGVRLPLGELSDGYRTTAALVLDIVRHFHDCFGALDVDEPRRQVRHSGVVLIDEVDLHLHVSWQKEFGFWLKRHFPNLQFIVTTHSPFICQAADPGGLIRLPAPGENRRAEPVPEFLYNTVVNGSADDAVLTELFGLETPYSEQSERLRERVAQLEALLQAGKGEEHDREELEELRSRLPQNLSTDVEQALRKLLVQV